MEEKSFQTGKDFAISTVEQQQQLVYTLAKKPCYHFFQKYETKKANTWFNRSVPSIADVRIFHTLEKGYSSVTSARFLPLVLAMQQFFDFFRSV